MSGRLRAALAVPPFRGDVVAAGVVALATATVLAVVRTDPAWAAGARLALVLPVLALVGGLALATPQDGTGPRPYHLALHLATLVLLVLAMREVAHVAGAGRLAQSAVQAPVAGALGLAAWWFARARDSAPCTLVAAGAAGWAVLALVDLVFAPDDATGFRWPLLGLLTVYALGAVARRDRARRHAAALADAAALAAIGIAYASLDFGAGAGMGWELVLFAVGFGLLAYGAVDRERVVAGLGGVVLAGAVLVAGVGEGGLLWWPALLGAGGVALLAIGLRPTTPAPPPPDDGEPSAEPVPLEPLRRV